MSDRREITTAPGDQSHAAVSRRADGWPFCPVCGEDELGDLSDGPADPAADLFCYRCGRVTMRGGVSVAASTIEVSVEAARDAVVALTEMRGWVGGGSKRERDFMLPRIDICVEAFGVAQAVRDAHHDVMEGVRDAD